MKKRIFVTLLALVMALGLTVTAAAADLPEVNYIDPTKPADQQTQTCTDYTVVTDRNESVTWSDGWYVVSGNVNIGNESNFAYVTVTGDVHLILCDGATLTVNGRHVGNTINGHVYGIHLESGASLTVYGQSAGTGTLDVSQAGYAQFTNEYPQHSLQSKFATLQYSAGIDLNGGSLTINGGHVMAGSQINVGGGNRGLFLGTLNMNGGKLTANCYRSDGIGNSAMPISSIDIRSDCYKWRLSINDNVSFTPSSTKPYTFNDSDLVEDSNYAVIVAGHEFGDLVQATPATCTTDGNRGHLKCSLCGKETDAAGVEITADENLTIPATGHQFVGRTCTVCGYEQPGHEPIRRQNTAAATDTTDTADTTVVASPKTFDAGVAVYGAMAIAAALGMGYVGKKRA